MNEVGIPKRRAEEFAIENIAGDEGPRALYGGHLGEVRIVEFA